MHTLQLYTRCDGDMPLALITVPNQEGDNARLGYGYVKVVEDSDIFRIKNGTNPRALNTQSPKVKAIRKTLEELPGFAVYNGGICIVVDDDSLKYDPETETISFTCNDPDSGHYDGQHTREALWQSAASADDQQFALMVVERRFFTTPTEIRRAAETWNSRATQKAHSEQNQRGAYDNLKSYLSTSHEANIGWRENERNAKGLLIEKECRIDRVAALLYTCIPVLRSTNLDTGDTMYGILRSGFGSTKIFEDAKKSADFAKLFGHANFVLTLNDYIQTTLKSAYTTSAPANASFDDLAIVRKSGKPDMKKPVTERKFLAQMLFNAERIEAGLRPEYIQPIMYGMMKNVLKKDRNTGAIIIGHGYTEADVKSIWHHAAYSVLTMLNDNFNNHFSSRFNSRHAEFGCWSTLWDECYNVIEEVIDSGVWRANAAAAK